MIHVQGCIRVFLPWLLAMGDKPGHTSVSFLDIPLAFEGFNDEAIIQDKMQMVLSIPLCSSHEQEKSTM